MPLILAIEPDRRQAARITSLARERLDVELLVMDSAERALEALSERIPDLILTPQLLSPKDETALNERLRQLDAAGAKVQTLMIPVLASTGRRASRKDGLLNRLRRIKDEPATEGGCDPAVFAAQIAEYLQKAADERTAQAIIAEDERADRFCEPKPPIVGAPAPGEVVVPESERYEFRFQQSAESLERSEQEVEPEYLVPPTPVNHEETDVLATLSSEADEPLESPEPVAAPLPSAFEEFVVFEELSVVDSPTLAFGELTAAMEHAEAEPIDLHEEIDLQAFAEELEASATAEVLSIFDTFEILDEPEIPIPVDFQPHERVERERRPLLVDAGELDDETEPDPRSSAFDFHSDLWMPLPVAAQWHWPTIEGPAVKAIFTHSFDAPPDPDVQFAPPPEDRGSAKKRKGSKPYQDEWGFFDPVQCGFAALLAKLDEVTDKQDASVEPAKPAH